jgi:hypothetical protein
MQALKTLVVVLGVLIVISIAALGWAFYRKLSGPTSLPAEDGITNTDTSVVPGFGDVHIDLPPDCSATEMRAQGDRLFIRTGPAGLCERILVIDTTTGRLLGTVNLKP